MKTCNKCKQNKPLSAFTKNKNTKDGLDKQCRVCKNARETANRSRRSFNAAYENAFFENYPGMKECLRCAQIKPVAAFIKKGTRSWRAVCLRCNQDAINTRKKTDAGFKERVLAANRANHRNSPRQTLRHALRHALRRRPSDHPVTVNELMNLWHAQSGRCALSGIRMTWASGYGKPMATSVAVDRIDHDKGYERGNVRLLCYAVNCFRGTMSDADMRMMLDLFWRYQFGYAMAFPEIA